MSKQVVHIVCTVITLPYLQRSVNSELGRMYSNWKRMSCKSSNFRDICQETYGKTTKALSQDKPGSDVMFESQAFAFTKQKY